MLIVAHGSRDPRHAATVSALAARVRSLAPVPRVAVSFLEFNAPRVPQALVRLHGAGERQVTAVPLLLSRAYHAKTDIPAVLAGIPPRLPGLSVRQAEVLGPVRADARDQPWRGRDGAWADPHGPGASGSGAGSATESATGSATAELLAAALERRLAEAGLPVLSAAERRRTGVVLASAGTSDPAAIAVIEAFARWWRQAAGWARVVPAFASAAFPRTPDAVRALSADGIRRVAVAPCVIAPGRLPDRIVAGAREAHADVLAPVLGDAPELARLLVRRYREAGSSNAASRLAG
ncbi:sirohydrochlorin chelatase [Streptomyces sp. 6N223]|uniref:sirohydrochlorin chelatase n=1 Tax=Streptomyces sp. 6N223 TaxID=3457412 RepID=UPI003FD268E7